MIVVLCVGRTVVKLLVSWGANVNFRDMTGETPLHKAAFGNHVAVINVLIKAGADRDVRNKDGLIAMDLTEERSTRFALAPPEIVDGTSCLSLSLCSFSVVVYCACFVYFLFVFMWLRGFYLFIIIIIMITPLYHSLELYNRRT